MGLGHSGTNITLQYAMGWQTVGGRLRAMLVLGSRFNSGVKPEERVGGGHKS